MTPIGGKHQLETQLRRRVAKRARLIAGRRRQY
jgi:hypothetical protein